jgi:hypothetical protein
LMGGQACVLFGAAEYSRDLDLAVLATEAAPYNTHADVFVNLLSLDDLVSAKKTQRDKDWPMLRRVVDASYAGANDQPISDA